MKNNILNPLVLVFLFTTTLNAQFRDIRETGEFTSLSVSGKIRVEIFPAGTDSVILSAKEADTEYVITERNDGELEIRLKSNSPGNTGITAEVYFSSLEKIRVNGQAQVVSPDTLKAASMIFESRTGGKMELLLDIDEVEADVRQGGILVFSGETDQQKIHVSSGGTYSAFALEALSSEVKATTGGIAKITTLEKLRANANTSGYIGYKGEPENTSVKTGLGGDIMHLRE